MYFVLTLNRYWIIIEDFDIFLWKSLSIMFILFSLTVPTDFKKWLVHFEIATHSRVLGLTEFFQLLW